MSKRVKFLTTFQMYTSVEIIFFLLKVERFCQFSSFLSLMKKYISFFFSLNFFFCFFDFSKLCMFLLFGRCTNHWHWISYFDKSEILLKKINLIFQLFGRRKKYRRNILGIFFYLRCFVFNFSFSKDLIFIE